MQFNLPSFPRFTEVVQNRADRITQTQITTNQIYLKILLQPVIFAEKGFSFLKHQIFEIENLFLDFVGFFKGKED